MVKMFYHAVDFFFQDSVKEKDQTIRKYEQEIESLTFRNKQLTSRVEVLQRELEGSGVKVKKSKVSWLGPLLLI